MSTRTQWILGLVAAALLFGGGALLGHLLSTSSDAERQAWEARIETLLGEARTRHLAVTDSLQRRADSTEAEAAAEAARARAEQAARAGAARAAAALARTTDSLQGVLAAARSAGDSLPVLTALVRSVTGERDQARADAARDSSAAHRWQAAYQDQLQSSAALRQRRTEDSTRIMALEGELRGRPKADRWKLELLGLEFRPCAFSGVDVHGRTTAGAGACVTP